MLPSVERYFTTSSLAPGGFLGFFIYSRRGASCATPRMRFEGSHYNAELHRSAFALRHLLERAAVSDLAPGTSASPAARWYELPHGLGVTQALDVQRIHAEATAFQEIEVFDHRDFGRVLALDGTVQLSQADEFVYHEMAVHVALLGRRRERARVLIVGGGDGGIVPRGAAPHLRRTHRHDRD